MKKLFSLSLIVFLFVVGVKAQVVRGLVRSAKNQAIESTQDRANKEVEKKVDKGVNKFFDNLIKEDTTANEKPASEQASDDGQEIPKGLSKMLGSIGMNANVKYKESYSFNSEILMTIEMTDADGNKLPPSEYSVRMNDKTNDFGMLTSNKEAETTFVFDTENQCTLFLTNSNGQKSGLATSLNTDELKKNSAGTENASENTSEADCFKKTGNKKNISGYSCEEYRCEDSEGITSTWITRDLDSKINRIYNSGLLANNYGKANEMNGVAIEYHFKSKKDRSESRTTLKSFDMNKKSSISTAGYQISGMSFKQPK